VLPQLYQLKHIKTRKYISNTLLLDRDMPLKMRKTHYNGENWANFSEFHNTTHDTKWVLLKRSVSYSHTLKKCSALF